MSLGKEAKGVGRTYHQTFATAVPTKSPDGVDNLDSNDTGRLLIRTSEVNAHTGLWRWTGSAWAAIGSAVISGSYSVPGDGTYGSTVSLDYAVRVLMFSRKTTDPGDALSFFTLTGTDGTEERECLVLDNAGVQRKFTIHVIHVGGVTGSCALKIKWDGGSACTLRYATIAAGL